MKTLGTIAILAALVICNLACTSHINGKNETSGKAFLAWDQPMSAQIDRGRYRFAVYVDSVRVELPDAGCNEPVDGVAVCSSRLPSEAMAPGHHRLSLVSYTLPHRVDSPKAPEADVDISRF